MRPQHPDVQVQRAAQNKCRCRVKCPPACPQTPATRRIAAPDPCELTDQGQRAKDVAGRVPAWPRPGVVTQSLAARPHGRFSRPRRRLRVGLVQLLWALAGLRLGLLLSRITTESTGGQHSGDGRAGRGGLRRPGAGDRHLLAAFPGRAMGLQQPVAPAHSASCSPAASARHHRAPPPAASRRSPHSALQSRSWCFLLRGHIRPFCPRSYTVVVFTVPPASRRARPWIREPARGPPPGPAGPERRGRSECRVHPFWGDAIPVWRCSSGTSTEERSVVPAEGRCRAAEPGGSGHDCDG